jgi:hypothetical protein
MSPDRHFSRNEADAAALAAQAVYTKPALALYDLFVLGFCSRFVWRCPTRRMLEFYNTHISANHLDCGVGTGYFLDHCTLPANARIELFDLNRNSLYWTARRTSRYRPKAHRGNVLKPFNLDVPPFDSIGMNYLLHCLPGDLRSKSVVFDHAAEYLNPGGVLFGCTLLQGGVERGIAAQWLMKLYNAKGIFCNADDDLAGLKQVLMARFSRSAVEVAGCAALFWARR